MSLLTVAADGSCLKNPGGPIGWAWADNKGRWMSNGLPAGTNQRAELIGFISILIAFPNTPLHVQLDSQYTLNVAETWIYGWAKKNWKRDNKPLQNLDIIKPMHRLLTQRKQSIQYEWVKGHTNNALNNVADLRAGEASRRAKAKIPPYYLDSTGATTSPKQQQLLTLLVT